MVSSRRLTRSVNDAVKVVIHPEVVSSEIQDCEVGATICIDFVNKGGERSTAGPRYFELVVGEEVAATSLRSSRFAQYMLRS
jgi:hypothetical protein